MSDSNDWGLMAEQVTSKVLLWSFLLPLQPVLSPCLALKAAEAQQTGCDLGRPESVPDWFWQRKATLRPEVVTGKATTRPPAPNPVVLFSLPSLLLLYQCLS